MDKSESRRLGKWLDSPFHNQRDDVCALHAYLTGAEDRLHKTSALTKTRIWKRIFPQTPFDDARLRQTFHWALKATEAFLAYENWQTDSVKPQLALINELNRRRIPKVTERSIKQTDKILTGVRVRNESYFRQQYLFEQEKDYYRDFSKVRAAPRFQEVADNLDVTYLIEKLRASWNMLYHQRLYRTEYDIRFLDEVISYVEEIDLEKYPVLAVHYYGYRGLTQEDFSGETIALLRAAVREHGELLSGVDRRHVILMAINLCITNMNRGHEAFIREAFEWYRLGLEQDVISEEEKMTRNTFWNVVAIALKLKEYDWTEDFIEHYSYQLEQELRQNTERFARANLSYARQDLDTAMSLLVTVDFKHPVFNISTRILLSKIYYELDEFDALDSQLDSTTTYIRRKKLADVQRNNYSNITRMIRQLSRIGPYEKGKIAELRKRVETTTPLTEKKWLLAQLEAL